jgi:hypothetical protein
VRRAAPARAGGQLVRLRHGRHTAELGAAFGFDAEQSGWRVPTGAAGDEAIALYIPVVARAVSGATARSLAEESRAQAVVRRNSRGGRNAAENFIAVLRCLYRHAVADRILAEAENPALKVAKP